MSNAKPIQRTREELVARDVMLTDDADVMLTSGGTVRLGPGFHAEEGSKLRVYTDPDLSEPPEIPNTSSLPSLASTEGETTSTSNAAVRETETTEESTSTALSKRARAVPDEFSLGSNYPNPFRTSTEICFGLPEVAEVSLEIYDMLGRRVARLASGQIKAGYHRVRLDGSELSSGVYVYRLVAGEFAPNLHGVLL